MVFLFMGMSLTSRNALYSGSVPWWKGNIHFLLQAACLLAAFRNSGYIVIYAPGDFFPCRRDAS
ncbi:hypothetical protein BVD23_09850 [Salmonella enterica]|nr:hypothetical protein [Salmonella enterica]EBI8099928.1 hypothetical protein [Salmonella enterica]EBK3005144.1 hypothetical protein [Salmonella enterica]EBK9151452.1 hypothetical protein [Salmonella enterica]EBL6689713.1 hypothetical protein [Salmonella enterica]